MKHHGCFCCAVALMLATIGCNSVDSSFPTQKAKGDTIVTMENPNLYNLNFMELYYNIQQEFPSESHFIRMGFFYEVPYADIIFTANGDIYNMNFSFSAPIPNTAPLETGIYNIRSNFKTEHNNSPTLPELFLAEETSVTGINLFYESSFANLININNSIELKQFFQWLTDADFKSLVDSYMVNQPIKYKFLSGPIESNVWTDSLVNMTVVEVDGNSFKKKERYDIIDKLCADQMTIFMELKGYDYFLIIPYYEDFENLNGCFNIELGQNVKHRYVANNLIVILYKR